MAKRLLLDVLVKVLGEFIELNEDNLDLSLAVWSGHIALKDLKLKTHKLLRNFDLSILHGEIKTLEVTIPWTALLNSPVKVLIDGVNLQVGPLNVAALDKEETKKRVISAKMQKLRMVDRFIDFSSSGVTGSVAESDGSQGEKDGEREKKQAAVPNARATYVQQWTSKIIDNIEITLKNVHIRYEDSQTIPGSPFSAGVTLNSFTLSTCDEKWHEKFVARDINQPTSSIRKMAKVFNFGLYWITKSTVLSGESFKDWSSKMQALIYPGLSGKEKSFFGDIQYVLHPANNLVVRLIHNERAEEDVPKFDMIVESTNLPLSIDRVQYLQLLRTMEMIGVTERRRQPYMYRPYERPSNPERARAWWKYACKMVVKRVHYIRFVKLSKSVDENTGVMDVRSADEKRQARELEERMPLRSLVIFRHAAAREMQVEAKKRYLQQIQEALADGLKHPLRNPGPVHRTWLGWAAGFEGDLTSTAALNSHAQPNMTSSDGNGNDGSGEEEEKKDEKEIEIEREREKKIESEGDVSIASIISSLEKKDDEIDLSRSASLFRLSLTTSASLDISVGCIPVSSATMALTIICDVTTWGISAAVHMRGLLVTDKTPANPMIKNIIAVKLQSSDDNSRENILDEDSDEMIKQKHEDSSPSFSIIYENLNSRTVIRISALPIEITLNKLCIQQLIGLFLAPASSSNKSKSPRSDINKMEKKKSMKSSGSVTKSTSRSISTTPQKPVKLIVPAERKSSEFFIDGMQSGSEIQDFKFRVVDSEKEEKRKNECKDECPNVDRQGEDDDNDDEENERGKEKEDGDLDEISHHTGRDGDLEIIFEAHAPKIIIPQDTSSNRDVSSDPGYLLLDTGYLVVRGFLGSSNMSWDVSLKRVNAGMPRTVEDMYGLKEQSLYLIKPFDISAEVQTVDTTTADMTVDITIKPEVRGELDASKLSRLLEILPVISATFARANCLASVSLPIEAMLPSKSTSTSTSTSTSNVNSNSNFNLDLDLDLDLKERVREGLLASSCFSSPIYTGHGNTDTNSNADDNINRFPSNFSNEKKITEQSLVGNGMVFQLTPEHSPKEVIGMPTDESVTGYTTPPQSPPPSSMIQKRIEKGNKVVDNIVRGGGREEGTDWGTRTQKNSKIFRRNIIEDDPNLTLPLEITEIIPDISDSRSALNGSELEQIIPDDPLHVSMIIKVTVPEVALDLTYDILKGRHLVLSVRTLEMQLSFRSHDMQILFDLSELSIQDSLRSASQRDLARTPRGEKSLIHVSYTSMYSTMSPFYRKHATEVVVEFAGLDLNFDVNTIMHLRPFMEVLLTRKVSAAPSSPSPSSFPSSISSCPTPVQSPEATPKTMPDNSGTSISSPVTTLKPELGLSDSTLEMSKIIPKGMEVIITVSNISLDLLRVSTSESEGAMLANAFSLQITDLRAIIDIIDVVKADVKLRSFDIIDTRAVSADYVFKKVFCPVVDMDQSLADWRSHAVTQREDKEWKKKELIKRDIRTVLGSADDGDKDRGKKLEENKENKIKKKRHPDLLHVTYAQISSTISAVEVVVLNVTSFVATDTILDLSYVAMANFFAILDLIATPSPSPSISPSVVPSQSSCPTQKHSTRRRSIQNHLTQPIRSTDKLKMNPQRKNKDDMGEEGIEEHESDHFSKNENLTTKRIHSKSLIKPEELSILRHQSSRSNDFENDFGYEIEDGNSSRRSSISPAGKSFAFERNSSPKKNKNKPSQYYTQKKNEKGKDDGNYNDNGNEEEEDEKEEKPTGVSSTMTVIVKVTNPRLILLEDPTSEESKAVVGSCEIEVHYSRENILFSGVDAITKLQNKELRESLHVSIHNHEVFVLKNMLLWHPLPVVEPMGAEFNLRRCTKNGILVTSSLSVDLDNINARVSVNDVSLLQSIFTRRSLTEPAPAPAPAPAPVTAPPLPTQSTQPSLGTDTSPLSVEPDAMGLIPSSTISLNMGSFSLVGINDFNGQNVPVIRTLLDGTTFYAETSQHKMHGEGSLIACADFYNPKLSVWEPIMDRWHPLLSLTSWDLGSSVELKSDHTMQLTVSGIMLEKLLETYSLFFRLDDLKEREEVPDVLIINALGSDISFDIYDSASNICIMNLERNEAKPLPRLPVNRKNGNRSRNNIQSSHSMKHTPTVVDIHFKGNFGDQRLPLRHLPFNVNKPRAYNLQPRPLDLKEVKFREGMMRGGGTSISPSPSSLSSSSASSSLKEASSNAISPFTCSVVLEPIVEEVFESSRYDPITGRWRQPYLPGDPYEWTDASSTIRKEIQSIQLHSDKWEWSGEWAVDMDAAEGDGMDRDGWEYATTFSSFSIASRRRSNHALDCVRRRRWLRTRVPRAGTIDERFRPLTIFWDVQVLQSGTRRVDVRSGLLVRNFMPFPIVVSLHGSAWHGGTESQPIEEDQTYNVPLLHASASTVKMRPFGFNYDWSQEVSCCLQTSDFSSMRDIHCNSENGNGNDNGSGNRNNNGEDSSSSNSSRDGDDGINPVCMRVLCAQRSKSLTVTIAPFVVIANRLPCDLQYQCNASDERRDEGRALSGSTCKLASISLSYLPKISFRIGQYQWSSPVAIDQLITEPIRIEILDLKNSVVLILTMITKSDSATGTVEVCVCSKGMLCDRTGGLGVSIWSRRGRSHDGVDMVRNTFRAVKSADTVLTNIVRPSVSSADKLRRKAAVRAAGKLSSKGCRLMSIDASPRPSTLPTASANAANITVDTAATRSDDSADGVTCERGVCRLKSESAEGSGESSLKQAQGGDSLVTEHSQEHYNPSILELKKVTNREEDSFGGPLDLGVECEGADGLSDSDEESFDSDDVSVHTGDGDRDGMGSELRSDHSSVAEKVIGLKVKDFIVQSSRAYEITRADAGDKVYTDRAVRFTHLPSQLRKQLFIRTPYDDKLTRSKNLLHFSMSRPSMVLVLIDMRTVKSPPKWLLEDGFRRITDQAIACVIQSGQVQESFFGIFGKCYGKNESVFLKGNWSKEVQSMYSVFILPTPSGKDLASNPGTGTGTGTFSPNSLIKNVRENSTSRMISGANANINSTGKNNGDMIRMFEEIAFDDNYNKSENDSYWVEGGNGLSLYHSEDDIVSIGLKGGSIWGDELNINMMTSSPTGSFEVIDWDSMRSYQLSYSMSIMPGLFSNTQLLTITPRYCIVNCLSETIMVVQKGSKEILEIAPYQAEGWHKSRASSGTSVQLRSTSSIWSLGSVDLNEVGRSVIHLPQRVDANLNDAASNNTNEEINGNVVGNGNGNENRLMPFIILVEVKIAEPSEHCSLVVVIWQATIETSTALAIHNDSDVHVTVKQADIDFDSLGVDKNIFDITVPPHTYSPFGWADPDISTDILVTAGSSMIGSKLRIARLNLLKAGEQLRLPDNSGKIGKQGEVVLSVLAEGGGRVLRISRSVETHSSSGMAYYNTHSSQSNSISNTNISDNDGSNDMKDNMSLEIVKSFGLSFSLASFGLSLVVEKPIRREFLSLYVDGLEGRWKTKGVLRSFEFMIMDLQIDNYSETVIYPVLLHSAKKEIHKSLDLYPHDNNNEVNGDNYDNNVTKLGSTFSNEIPLIQVTMIEELQRESATSSTILKYVCVRILPVSVEVESATLQLLFSDLISDLKFVDRAQTIASTIPHRWIAEFNRKIVSPADRNMLVDVYRSQIVAQATKMYIEKLLIHPMKITLTFLQTPFPRKRGKGTLQAAAINILTSLAGVDRMQLRLKSFEVDDVLESRSSLIDLIVHKTVQDLQSQLAQIAGSLTVLGSPMGLARKIGSGVKSFFYEPYQGAVLGPQDFVVGLGRGTSHLFANVVSGAMNSTVALVGTASKGISFLSGDAEYARRRALRRQRNRANRGGIVDGILDGSESIISGVTSGMSGLVTKPFEEAKKSGVKGFFCGVGLGLIGAAVKPVLGITDGLTSVASGVSNQVGLATVHVLVRPARAFERSASDASDLVLVPLNLEAAFAQEFVIRRAKSNGYEDTLLSYIPMELQGEAMILSETYVYWRKPKSLWGRTWANISHCFFRGDSIGIVLYGGEAEAVMIPCGNQPCAIRVYSALAHNAQRMGRPSNIIPVDLVIPDRRKELVSSTDDMHLRQMLAESLAGEIEGYRFGTANKTALRKIIGPESDVLKRIEGRVEAGFGTLKDLDDSIWRLVWEWDCTHMGLQASRCCATVIINRSNSPLQIARVQIVHGKNVMLIGSVSTGYEIESRVIMPGGSALVFLWAFSPSPIEIGHLKAVIGTAAFAATVASTQRESHCEAKGGFTVGFLEKSVSDWWSKYVILVT